MNDGGKEMKKKVNFSLIFAVIFSAVCVLGFAKNYEFCVRILGRATVLSVSTVLPVGFDMSSDKEPETSGEATDGEAPSETDKAENGEAPSGAADDGESVSSPQTDSDFTATPDDIKKLTEKYAQKADKDKKDGSISEQTYKNSGVTDSYGKVRIKSINDTKVNIKKLLGEKADLSIKDKSKPVVLIFHTHTTERYQIIDRSFYATGYTSRSEDPKQNMVRVGDAICEQLEKAGYGVIHDTNIYDKKYNGAYNRSRAQIEKYLKKYPSIQVVLDIHRDAIELNNGTKIKPVANIKGKKCAQVMIISGCQEKGNGITGFEDWRYNLTFAVQLQNKMETLFPGLTRPLYFCPRKYNMDMAHCSLLIEMGSDANTLDEAVYAGKCLGVSLVGLMNDYTEQEN